MAFNPSRPAGLVSGSLKFLLSSLLLSEATVCAPSDKLAHVHLLGLAFLSSTSLFLSLCYLTAADHTALSVSQEDVSPEIFFGFLSGCLVLPSLSLFLPLLFLFRTPT